jgi:uncharacterized protein YdiU (UPF0061 family)
MSALQPVREHRLVDLTAAKFENTFVRDLPADTVLTNVPRPVSSAAYTRVEPTAVAAPKLLSWSEVLGAQLGLARPSQEAVDVLGGSRVLPAMKPYAARYGGHQFGHWAGQLGDGRAITLGELSAADGTRQELQLKGAGRTPYSRTADGRAVLRSSLREFACSEAMHFLGVPTTRALALVGTGEEVIRDMFYDGHPAPEPGAVVCRVSPSFLRFGNFQIYAAQREPEILQRLVDYVLREFYPGFTLETFYQELCRRTALLMVDWMRLGFVHGVMNTDNMSILGVTIDYGPYGWLEGYDPDWTPNTTDAQGRRYCYGNQPGIAQWNLARLAEALLTLSGDKTPYEEGLKLYADTFNDAFPRAVAAKLGLESPNEELVNDLWMTIGRVETDFTLFFRNLSVVSADKPIDALMPAFYAGQPPQDMEGWVRRWLALNPRRDRMNAVNPKYVFRNYLAQTAIDALEKGDAAPLERLMKVLERPYDEQPGNDALAERRPEWARHKAGCSALSCSS